MTKTLVHSSIVFRHGARGPTPTCLGRLEGTAAPGQWLPHEIGELNARGQRQAETLGRWIGNAYLAQQHPDFAKKLGPVLWYTSPSQRVIDSGVALVNALLDCDAVPNRDNLSATELRTRTPKHDELTVFRAYSHSKEYVSAVNACRAGLMWESYASEHIELLRQLVDPLFADQGGDQQQDGSRKCERTNAAVLDLSTYIHEVIECERFWEPAQDMVGQQCGNGNAHTSAEQVNDNSVGGGGTSQATSVRDAMLSLYDADALEAIESMAVWCWQGRFITMDEGKWARTLGGALLELIQDAAKASTRENPTLRLWAAHDYTILSVLAALLQTTYPGDGGSALGFGSFLVFEVWEDDDEALANDDGTPQRSVRVWLNAKPFIAQGGVAEAGAVQQNGQAGGNKGSVGGGQNSKATGPLKVTEQVQDTRIVLLDHVAFPPPSVL